MTIALLIVDSLLLLTGAGAIAKGSLPVIFGRVRRTNLATWLNLVGAVLAAGGLVLGVYTAYRLTSIERQDPTSQVTLFATHSPSPTLVSVPPLIPKTQPASTATPTGPWVTIATPHDGDSVAIGVRVQGQSGRVAAGQVPDTPPPWVYVAVRPLPGHPDQSWWVQPYPLIGDDGKWDTFIFAGQPGDKEGTPFDICAIVSTAWLPVGQYGGELPPAITRDCISVMR